MVTMATTIATVATMAINATMATRATMATMTPKELLLEYATVQAGLISRSPRHDISGPFRESKCGRYGNYGYYGSWGSATLTSCSPRHDTSAS